VAGSALVAAKDHYHEISLAKAGAGSIKARSSTTVQSSSYGEGGEVQVFAANGFSLSEENGTIYGSVTILGQESKDSFNMASTSFYKKAAVKNAIVEGAGGASSHIKITFQDDGTQTYDKNTLKLVSADKKVN
jgi:hypothetical protein